MAGEEFSKEIIKSLYKLASRTTKEHGAYIVFRRRNVSQKHFCRRCIESKYIESVIVTYVWGPLKDVFNRGIFMETQSPLIGCLMASIAYIEDFCYKISDIQVSNHEEKKLLQKLYSRLIEFELSFIDCQILTNQNQLKDLELVFGKENIKKVISIFNKANKPLPSKLL